ncbi:MAG: hypothetical protein K0Q85_104 [Caproiciproducens sp.]|nr:hypothetical protein [Caproiciproducens sp.]
MEIGVKEIELIVQQVIQNMDRSASPAPLRSSVGKGDLGVLSKNFSLVTGIESSTQSVRFVQNK